MENRYNSEEGYTEKYCPRCKEWWPADSEFFTSDRSSKDGLYHWCKACFTEWRRRGKPPTGILPQDLIERDRDVVRLKVRGMTFQEVGDALGMTRRRAQQIYSKKKGSS